MLLTSYCYLLLTIHYLLVHCVLAIFNQGNVWQVLCQLSENNYYNLTALFFIFTSKASNHVWDEYFCCLLKTCDACYLYHYLVSLRIYDDFGYRIHKKSGLSTLCFKKVWKLCKVLNVHVTAGHRPAQARRSQLAGALFPFLSEVTDYFCKIESKFLNSRLLADGFVMECAKKYWF